MLSVDEGLSALFNFGPAGNPAVPNRFWRCLNISNKDMQINEQIRDREIRVITDAGEQLGIMSAREALRIAEEKDLDLVKIAPQATPPVCKIMDYGKYRFEQAKREKEARKNQHIVEIKEIRLSLNIDKHDFETKAGHQGFHPVPWPRDGAPSKRLGDYEALCTRASRGEQRRKTRQA